MLEELTRVLTPNNTALLANYPNPFNPETWIPYQLSKAADVTITIYASDGNVVRTLTLGHQDVGMYKNRSRAAYWDGKNEVGESVASGFVFLYAYCWGFLRYAENAYSQVMFYRRGVTTSPQPNIDSLIARREHRCQPT